MNKVNPLSLAIIAVSILPGCSNNHIPPETVAYIPAAGSSIKVKKSQALPIATRPQVVLAKSSHSLVPKADPMQVYHTPSYHPKTRQRKAYPPRSYKQNFTSKNYLYEPINQPTQARKIIYQTSNNITYKQLNNTSNISDDELYSYALELMDSIQTNSSSILPQKRYSREHSTQELRMIGNKIFQNECGGQKTKLVHWNVGEEFASMGIGHFLWQPNGPRRGRFGNTFPGLLSFMQQRGVQLPSWLANNKSRAPWNSREELQQSRNTKKVKDLEDLLYRTQDIQAEYILQRAKKAMHKLVKATPSHLKPLVAQNLNAVGNTKGGWYALVDYVNFKGEGLSRNGGYKGQNWGLLQVLENMTPSQQGQDALNNFSTAALNILKRRIRNSPPSRNEGRWLAGWSNRVKTYRYPML